MVDQPVISAVDGVFTNGIDVGEVCAMKSVVRTLMHNFIETQDRCHTSVSYQETKPTNIEIPMTAPPLWQYDMIGILVTLW